MPKRKYISKATKHKKVKNTDVYDSDSDQEETEVNVHVENNRIYFHTDVTTKSIFEFIKIIRKLDIEMQVHSIKYNVEPSIYIHINSVGGDLLAGFAAVDAIRDCKTNIISIVEGCAASAATLMTVVCDKRIISKHAHMLVHQVSGGVSGKRDEIEEELHNLKHLDSTSREIYLTRTKIPKKQLEEILKKDVWWNAKKCLKFGLVDKINK